MYDIFGLIVSRYAMRLQLMIRIEYINTVCDIFESIKRFLDNKVLHPHAQTFTHIL